MAGGGCEASAARLPPAWSYAVHDQGHALRVPLKTVHPLEPSFFPLGESSCADLVFVNFVFFFLLGSACPSREDADLWRTLTSELLTAPDRSAGRHSKRTTHSTLLDSLLPVCFTHAQPLNGKSYNICVESVTKTG